MGVQACRVVGRVGQGHQRASGLGEAVHRAAAHHDLGTPVGQVEAPQVALALLLGGEQQRQAVIFPLQRRVDDMVPFGADHLDRLAGRDHRQLRRHGVLDRLVAGGEGDPAAVGAVARVVEIPSQVLRHRLEAAAFQIQFSQREAAVHAFLGCRVVGEDQPLAVGREVEAVGVRVGAHQLVGGALEQVAHAAGVEVHQQQVRHAAHRQHVVPVAVDAFAGGDAGFLARLEVLHRLGLGLGAFQIGPDPRHEHDAPAVGAPAEGLDAGGHVADALRLAAVDRDDVELRRFVLATLLLALGDEADAVAAR